MTYQLPANIKWTKHETYNDRWVVHTLRGMNHGVAVECGAWQKGPMTLALSEHFQWKSILIEADPKNLELLRAYRYSPRDTVVEAVVLKDTRVVEFNARQKGGYSNVTELQHFKPVSPTRDNFQAIGTTLTEIFNRQQLTTINFLCLDMEGGEIEALQGLDFNRWQPWLISVEAGDDPARRQVFLDLLLAQDYHEVKNPFTKATYEMFFARNGLEELLA